MREAAGGLNSLKESDKSCKGVSHHALAPRKRGRRIQSLRAFRLALFSWFGGSGILFCLVCLVDLVGLVCLFFVFQNGKKSNVGVFFIHLLMLFHGILELGGHFF